MKVAIHQPNFLPHYGYFKKIAEADLFVFLDHVQFSKGSYTNRVSANEGWLSMPCIQNTGQNIIDTKIFSTEKSYRKLEGTLYQNYRLFHTILKPSISERFETIADFNIDSIKLICKYLNINTELIRSSDLDIKGQKNDMLIDILNKVEGNKYLTGNSDYLDREKFIYNGIKLEYFDSMKYSNGKSVITQI